MELVSKLVIPPIAGITFLLMKSCMKDCIELTIHDDIEFKRLVNQLAI
jgi:hypothetical protein